MSINTKYLDFQDRTYLPDTIIEKSKSGQLSLDDLYALGTDVYGEITLFGYDSFSGTKKHFCSHQYRIEDLLNGEFDLNSFKIKQITPASNSQQE